jgi:hypothetical protein
MSGSGQSRRKAIVRCGSEADIAIKRHDARCHERTFPWHRLVRTSEIRGVQKAIGDVSIRRVQLTWSGRIVSDYH